MITDMGERDKVDCEDQEGPVFFALITLPLNESAYSPESIRAEWNPRPKAGDSAAVLFPKYKSIVLPVMGCPGSPACREEKNNRP
jgi:hypothetical protein